MTPELRQQIDACKSRIKYARLGGIADEIVRANLIAEDFPSGAVKQAFEELDIGSES